ncbi:MFS transporter [Paraburkholderia megapolitana]|uniref:Predicted arabinose efflux permease, MFS family n=1 Tax=Paraburkholderia megapolitana TaxID=420953 RepID=A0A1I3WAL8_9BURK|nr:MFS transporter [Paraburkholderia megapolitana]QDQ82228.1 MFS transporter [Paraburkholderia megapolitana]SFK04233.1 Predicted arabinose efflux permease, MFS family [Paraburkholderia megapolitana]
MRYIYNARQLGLGMPQVLASEALTWLGLMMGHITVMWWVTQSGGVRDLSVFGVVIAVISLATAPWLSPLGDRFPKRTMRVLAIGLFALVALAMELLAWNNIYDLAALIVLEAIALCANAIFASVSSAQLIELADTSFLSKSFAYQKSAQSVGRLAGPGVAGPLLSVSSTANAFLIQAVVLGIAALLACCVPWHAAGVHSKERCSWIVNIREGLRASMTVPLERNWILVSFLSSLFLLPVLNMLVPLKVQSLQLSGKWFGWCEAMLSLGMLLSALKGTEITVRWLGRRRARIVAGILLALGLVAFGASENPMVLLATFCVAGFAQSTLMLVGFTHRTLARPTHMQARMAAIAGMSVDFASLLGPVLAGLALTRVSVGAAYMGFALCGALLALAVSWLPGVGTLLDLDHAAAEGWYAKVWPMAFNHSELSSITADLK